MYNVTFFFTCLVLEMERDLTREYSLLECYNDRYIESLS